jgi:hypothetical protein
MAIICSPTPPAHSFGRRQSCLQAFSTLVCGTLRTCRAGGIVLSWTAMCGLCQGLSSRRSNSLHLLTAKSNLPRHGSVLPLNCTRGLCDWWLIGAQEYALQSRMSQSSSQWLRYSILFTMGVAVRAPAQQASSIDFLEPPFYTWIA